MGEITDAFERAERRLNELTLAVHALSAERDALAEQLQAAQNAELDLRAENRALREAIEAAKQINERMQFLMANLLGYADLFEDAADAIEGHREPDSKAEFDAGLLRGLADRLRELKR